MKKIVPRSKQFAQIPDPSFLEIPEDFIRLDLSIAKNSPAGKVENALMAAIRSINRYPESNWHRLIQKIAELNHIAPSSILLVNGLDEGIDLLTRTFVDRDATVIIPTPTFSQFEIAALRQDAIPMQLNFLTKQEYEFDAAQLIETAHRENAQLIWICNPNNPTGIAPREEILEVIKNVECLVAVDECYFEFYGETVMNLISTFDNLLVLRSFSKTYGLAGLRIGFLAGNAERLSSLQKMRQPASVNRLAQVAALAALESPEYYKMIWKTLKEEKKTICNQLRAWGLDLLPTETNFILIRTSKAKEIFKALWNERIFVFGGWEKGEFSGLGDNFLRITIGSPEENTRVIKSLKTILA